MSARSFKSVGWVAGVGAAALGCYMLSLQVAAERAELSGIEARIVRTQQAIRDLQTELGTRGRLSQLEQWNAEVLALSAPVSGQFLENEVVLARLESPSGELGSGAQVRMASAATGETAPVAETQPRLRTAATVAPAAPTATPERAHVRRASLAAGPSEAQERPVATPASAEMRSHVAPQAAARAAAPVRAAALLDDGTTRQIVEAARAESRERRPARAAPVRPAEPASPRAAGRASPAAADSD